MTPARPAASVLMPVLLLLVAMFSIQLGASLAKSLFPVVGPWARLRCAWLLAR